MRITARLSRNCILVLTVCSVLSGIPVFWMYGNNARAKKCVTVPSASTLAIMRIYYTVLLTSFLTMFVIVVVSYSLVFGKVMRSKKILRSHTAADVPTTTVMPSYDGDGSSDTAGTSGPKLHETNRQNARRNQVAPLSPVTSYTSISERSGPGDNQLTALDSGPKKAGVGREGGLSTRLQVPAKVARGRPDYSGSVEKQAVKLVSIKPLPATPKGGCFSSRSPTIGAEATTGNCEPAADKTRSAHAEKMVISALTTQSFATDSGYTTSTSVIASSAHGLPAEYGSNSSNEKDERPPAEGVPAPLSSSTERDTIQADFGFTGQSASANHETGGSSAPADPCTNERLAPAGSCRDQDRAPAGRSVNEDSTNANIIFERNIHNTQRPLHIQAVTEMRLSNIVRKEKETSRDKESDEELSFCSVNKENDAKEAKKNGNRVPFDHDTFTSVKGMGNADPSLASSMHRQVRAPKHDSRSFRLALLLLLVTAVFVVSWIPPYVAMVWYFYVGYTPPLSAADIALQTYGPTSYILNSFVNPFIYAALSPAFRNTVISLWRQLIRFCCRR